MAKTLDKSFPKYLFSAFASLLFGVFLGFCVLSNLGADPMSTLVSGFSNTFHVSFSMMNFILNCIFIVIVLFIGKKHVKLVTYLSTITVTLGIQFITTILHGAQGAISWFYLAIGVIGSAFCIAWMIDLDCGKSAYDALILSFSDLTSRKYHEVRWVLDILFILVGALMHGTFGVGTFICLLLTGKLVEIFLNFIRKEQHE